MESTGSFAPYQHLETAAAYFAAKIYCNHLENTSMHLKMDTATVTSLNKLEVQMRCFLLLNLKEQ